MKDKRMSNKYVDKKLLEIYVDIKEALGDKRSWSESTRAGYDSNYRKLGMFLNKKPFLDYDLDEIEDVLTVIKRRWLLFRKEDTQTPLQRKRYKNLTLQSQGFIRIP